MADLDFDTFLQCEFEARRAAGSNAPPVTTPQARAEWLSKRRKREYIEALELLQASMIDAEECFEHIYDLPDSTPAAVDTAIAGLRIREGTLEAMVETCRAVYENLQRLQQEQAETDDYGVIIANQWTRWHTEYQMNGILGEIKAAQNGVQQCRGAREGLGSSTSPVEPLYPQNEDVKTIFGLSGTQDSEWVFIKELGEGGCGAVFLWARKDDNGNIVEKVAAKDCVWPPTFPIGIYNDGSQDRLREPYMHALLSDRDPKGLHTILYRGDRLFQRRGVHRIYLEFCAYGDIWSVMYRLHERRSGIDSKPSIAAMWRLFESLVKAQWLMTYGTFPNGHPPPGWITMLHRDIKPENVMLSTPSEDEWPGLPTMKLGDFGYAGLVNESTFQTTGCGTQAYCSPEMLHTSAAKLPAGVTISTPADIYSIGETMRELMDTGDPAQSPKPCLLHDPNSKPHKTGDSGRKVYPRSLVRLVERCLERLPSQRISLNELHLTILYETRGLSRQQLSEDDIKRFPLQDEKKGTIARLDL